MVAEASDDEEEKPLYNPLNIPLGWDGKPIPVWLYKLHGLGVSVPERVLLSSNELTRRPGPVLVPDLRR